MVTIVLLVSRNFLLDKLFLALNELECQTTETNLLCIVDGDLKLFLRTKKMVSISKFGEKLCIRADSTNPSRSQVQRRKRVAELHNMASQYIGEADYILTIEDDGIIPKDALVKLLKHMKNLDAGFVSGLELGRWTTAYPGGWLFDNPEEPNELRSVTLPDKPGLVKIHAAGWYCCLVKKQLYEGFPHSPDRHWGPDINFGRIISSQGHHNYMDTSIVVDHHTEAGKIINLATTQVRNVCLRKDKGTWRFIHHIQKMES